MIAAAWLIGPAFNLARFLPTTTVTPDGFCVFYQIWPNPFWEAFTIFVVCALELFIPLFIVAFLYITIFVSLRRRASSWRQKSDQSEKMNQTTVNVLKTMVLLTGVFFLCWVWLIVYIFLNGIGVRVSFRTPFYNFTVFMANINCCVNPFCYAVQYRDFQNQVRYLFCRGRSSGEEQNSVSRSSVSSRRVSENSAI